MDIAAENHLPLNMHSVRAKKEVLELAIEYKKR